MANASNIRSVLRISLLAAAVTAAVATPAIAQVVHSVSFGAGMFFPKSEDQRATGDTWVANLNQPVIPGTIPPATGSLAFNIKDFRSFPIFGEWHIGFGDHIEIGVGAAFMNQSVPSVYRDLVNGHGTDNPGDDTEIPQTLRLQTIPISAVVRFFGGRMGGVQPYAGGGLVMSYFNYTESGEFVDIDNSVIFNAKFTAKDIAFGPVILGGIRVPVGGDVYALNFEGRYQWVVGKTGGIDAGFLGEKLDLGGLFLTGSFLIRF